MRITRYVFVFVTRGKDKLYKLGVIQPRHYFMDIGNKNKEDDSQNTGIISLKKDKDQKRKNGEDHLMTFFYFCKRYRFQCFLF